MSDEKTAEPRLTDEKENNDSGKFEIVFDRKLKVFPLIWLALACILTLLQWIIGLNMVAVIGVIFLCITSLLIGFGIIFKKKLYLFLVLAYAAVSFGIFSYYTIAGADAGWGAFSSGIKGFSTTENSWLQGEGTFWTRLLGNLVLISPLALVLLGLVLTTLFVTKNKKLEYGIACVLSVLLLGTSIGYVFYMNLRSNPKMFDMTNGETDYLSSVARDKTKSNSPNVIVILMDDLGFGDVGFYNAAAPADSITPELDALAYNGIRCDNFYSSYSVCSPSRFALLTGRYPYRGSADNVLYPTVNTTSVWAQTRLFNTFEVGNNVDGMMGDEITLAETMQSAGYATACIGKWHLGDYGQYLPTNQGFDYFYGSHQVNDMKPYYYVEEKDGQYTIEYSAFGSSDKDAFKQEETSAILHEHMINWLDGQIDADSPFFAYYSTPVPHAPLYAGKDFQGSTGLGTYADAVFEFDYYVGQLVDYLTEKGILDDTVIMFASDNGPALQGSTGGLRGGKYTAYEAGQKVPFFMYVGDNANLGALAYGAGDVVSAPLTMVDVFPTMVELLGINCKTGERAYLPKDRAIDGVSWVPVLKGEKAFVHDINHPILHMKRENLLAIQYSMSTSDVVAKYGESYAAYDYIQNNEYVTYKYFSNVPNDNLAFFDKRRKNWLICLTADPTESYNIQPTYAKLAEEMKAELNNCKNELYSNRRGYSAEYYKK